MPIVAAFTITSAAAVGLHSLYLWRTWLNYKAQSKSLRNGDRRRIAWAFVSMEATRSLLNLCLLIAGIGLLAGQRPFGYFLAAPPVLSLISSTIALRGIR